MSVDLILYIIAAICFAIAGFRLVNADRVDLIALGLFAWVLANIV